MRYSYKDSISKFRKNKMQKCFDWNCHSIDFRASDDCADHNFFGTFRLENAAVREIYPTYHVMFRNVSEETAGSL